MALKKFMVGLVALAALSCAATAKPKSHTFKADPEQVYISALRAIALHGRVQYANEKAGTISFVVDRSTWTGELTCSAIIRSGNLPGETEMVINVQKVYGQLFKAGAGDKAVADLFRRIEDDLNEKKFVQLLNFSMPKEF
jgi:hypothetical protein